MRRLAAVAAALLALTATQAARAASDAESEPLELPTAINNVLAGLNGLLTAPADPVASAIAPPEEFDELWGAPVTSHTLGFFQGVVMLPYRVVMGALDIAFAPFWVFPTLSPEARFDLVPGYDIQYE